MDPWIETLAAALVAMTAVVAGLLLSRSRIAFRAVACVLAGLVFVTVAIGRWAPGLHAVPPFSWMLRGRAEFVLMAAACPMFFMICLPRLRFRRQRVMVSLFVAVIIIDALNAFIGPALFRSDLAALTTRLDADGVCRQSNDYTCGPAAAVTALGRLGLAAEESELAMLAATSPIFGTPEDCLCLALEERYAAEGLECEYRQFASISELEGPGIALAVVKFSFLIDHWVAVLEVTPDAVVVGDPLAGKVTLPHAQFAERWRLRGLVLTRK